MDIALSDGRLAAVRRDGRSPSHSSAQSSLACICITLASTDKFVGVLLCGKLSRQGVVLNRVKNRFHVLL